MVVKIFEYFYTNSHKLERINIQLIKGTQQVVGYLNGKSAIHIARTYLGQKKNYGGMSFWARGYFVSTVGTDEEVVRAYIREQEKEDQRVEQLTLFKQTTTEWWSVNLFNIPL